MTAAATGKRAVNDAPAPERSKDRILNAAAELARERGVAGATIAQVCQRSGLPVSSVYWHFDDQDHLFAEVIRTSFARWLVSVPSWEVAADTTLEEGLKRVLIPSTRTLAEVPAFLRVGMQVLLESGEQNAKTREAFVDARNQVRLMIAAWLSSFLPTSMGADAAEDLATLVVAFTDGMLVGSQVYPDWHPEEFVELIAGTIAAAVDAAR
ncbi:MAG TPA: TetR/AcrR family transcriptional regulator [Pedococcus sp.]|nr:TetR/AcrR family transcriptional regulator [Pedococcus sp.]